MPPPLGARANHAFYYMDVAGGAVLLVWCADVSAGGLPLFVMGDDGELLVQAPAVPKRQIPESWPRGRHGPL